MKKKISLEDLGKSSKRASYISSSKATVSCCGSIDSLKGQGILRRDFLKYMGIVMGATAAGIPPVKLNAVNGIPYYIPANKNLDPNRLKQLMERGEPEIFTGKDLAYIGMPVGGICTGTVYLGGDGKLWLWDIFNQQKEGVISKDVHFNTRRLRARDGANYVFPVRPEYPFEQGFSIEVSKNGKKLKKKMDYTGFKDIRFNGQYPAGFVTYSEDGFPVTCKLTACSPFIPGKVDQSSYPATIMQFDVKNISENEVEVKLGGWLENAVMPYTGSNNYIELENTTIRSSKITGVATRALVLDNTAKSMPVNKQADFGDMSLVLLRDNKIDISTTAVLTNLDNLFNTQKSINSNVSRYTEPKIAGVIGRTSLAPGESRKFSFIISWYFPNLFVKGIYYTPEIENITGRSYGSRFKDAVAVSDAIGADFDYLLETTLDWVETFYEKSSLPHWLLNRTFSNTSTLATETAYLLGDGKFWAWEGIGCCPGTCTHVWHYAQALGRIFPEIEKNLRERTDFDPVSFNEKTGAIDFRGGYAKRTAADGQAGIVMRSYRDHQMSIDDTYLRKNWKYIRKTLEYLIDKDKEDKEADGMIFGEQHNTLDAEWFGNIPVITSLYLSALACGLEMATEIGDTEFAKTCNDILAKGQNNIKKMFNGEYFIQIENPDHLDAIGIGKGCYIDQVFGQNWAFQVGIGRLFNESMIKTSLKSLFKYNFVPDMGAFRASLPPHLAGRPYAINGDAGLVMCTWPLGGKRDDWEKHWQFGYFNECMTGFEHQVASHMMWEGMLEESITLTRAIHDRYHPSKRNPYNEVECSDHYARAMASYGTYIAASGFRYHGPKAEIGFAPRLKPEDFQCAFITAVGWGSFGQKIEGSKMNAELEIVYGEMDVQKVILNVPEKIRSCSVKMNGKTVSCKLKHEGNNVTISFIRQKILKNQKMSISLRF